jgi:FKBP-type peptidyl-prolyl cis-trans isomerase SlyD
MRVVRALRTVRRARLVPVAAAPRLGLVKKPAIADGCAVTIHYRLTLDDGSIADESFGGDPLVYLHGAQNIVPGLERELAGRNVGDVCEVTVAAADGYGEYDPTAEQTVPRTAFPPNVDVQAGMSFTSRGRGGQTVPIWVRTVKGDEIVVTRNHPMAGQRLNFRVEVIDVRRATRQEMEHGHVHGPGGHHH